ncbi:hypothetical protein [Corynebacterium mayonis]|uniref:hypothetical protein n=1 Tax=Corynebacterium mayonis TaxID=3062461 RepID=UPI00314068D6
MNETNGFIPTMLGGQASALMSNAISESISRKVVNQLFVGFNTLGDGLAQAAEGAAKLDDATATAAQGAHKLSFGAGELADGVGKLHEGAVKLDGGINDDAAGADKLSSGMTQLQAGTDTLGGGCCPGRRGRGQDRGSGRATKPGSTGLPRH